jgi:DNA-binding transcriptional ArsR family regulator
MMVFNSFDVRDAASVFKALSNPDRLKIACAMMDGRPTTETELVKETGWPQSTMNRHLTVLRKSGLLDCSRNGNSINLELKSPMTVALMKTMCGYIHDRDADTPAFSTGAKRRADSKTGTTMSSAGYRMCLGLQLKP